MFGRPHRVSDWLRRKMLREHLFEAHNVGTMDGESVESLELTHRRAEELEEERGNVNSWYFAGVVAMGAWAEL